jgi:hypothetical protein
LSSKTSLRSIARLLLIVGGLILILGAVLQLAGDVRNLLDLAPRVPSLGLLTSAIVGIVVGVLAFIGAGQVSNPAWAIVLMVLGFLVGSLGGILIFIGGLIALVAAFVKT